MNRTYYKLTSGFSYFEEYVIDYSFFKTRKDAEDAEAEMRDKVEYTEINEVSFDEMKCLITLSEFEKLFNIQMKELCEEAGIEL